MDTIISGNEEIIYLIKNIVVNESGDVTPETLQCLLEGAKRECEGND